MSNFTLNNVDPPKNTSEDSLHVKNIPIPELPYWSLKDKMSFFHSKQDYINTPVTGFLNTTQENTNSNPLLDGIFHLLSFFLLSSLLNFQLNILTLFTTLSFHVLAGFRDPAYLNNIFIGVGTVFSWGVSIIQLIYKNFHAPNFLSFSSQIPKYLILRKFSKFYTLLSGTKNYTHTRRTL